MDAGTWMLNAAYRIMDAKSTPHGMLLLLLLLLISIDVDLYRFSRMLLDFEAPWGDC